MSTPEEDKPKVSIGSGKPSPTDSTTTLKGNTTENNGPTSLTPATKQTPLKEEEGKKTHGADDDIQKEEEAKKEQAKQKKNKENEKDNTPGGDLLAWIIEQLLNKTYTAAKKVGEQIGKRIDQIPGVKALTNATYGLINMGVRAPFNAVKGVFSALTLDFKGAKESFNKAGERFREGIEGFKGIPRDLKESVGIKSKKPKNPDELPPEDPKKQEEARQKEKEKKAKESQEIEEKAKKLKEDSEGLKKDGKDLENENEKQNPLITPNSDVETDKLKKDKDSLSTAEDLKKAKQAKDVPDVNPNAKASIKPDKP